jgi:hypothetical protein
MKWQHGCGLRRGTANLMGFVMSHTNPPTPTNPAAVDHFGRLWDCLIGSWLLPFFLDVLIRHAAEVSECVVQLSIILLAVAQTPESLCSSRRAFELLGHEPNVRLTCFRQLQTY